MANPQKLEGKIIKIASFSENVFQVYIAFQKKVPKIKAGQFLHLALDEFDPTRGFWPESRVFSIAHIDEDRTSLSIVYSVKGKFTERMKNQLAVNLKVWIKLPYGTFIVKDDEKNIVLIAGGTGISPFIPFISGKSFNSSVRTYYGIKNPELLIFGNELQEALNADSNFELALFIENNIQEMLSSDVRYNKGSLSIEKIFEENKDIDSIYYISGPPEMIENFRNYLLSRNVNNEYIVIDEWS